MRTFNKSSKLENVLYDVRGPVVDEANRMEEMAHSRERSAAEDRIPEFSLDDILSTRDREYAAESANTARMPSLFDDEDIIDIFYDNLLGNVTLNNEELEKAHEEDSQYGIQNAAVKDNSLISKENLEDEDGEVIYTKVN